LVQGSEDVFRSRVFQTRLGRKVTVYLDLVAPTGKFRYDEFEGDVLTTFERGLLAMGVPEKTNGRNCNQNHNDLRSLCRQYVVCEPDGGIGSIPKLVNHSEPLVIDVSDVHGVVPPRYIFIIILHIWDIGVIITSQEGFRLDEGLLGSWDSIGALGLPGRLWRSNGRVPLHEFLGEVDT
jgi:hypothetical protein